MIVYLYKKKVIKSEKQARGVGGKEILYFCFRCFVFVVLYV